MKENLEKVLFEADMATAAFDYQWWADTLFDAIDYYELDVEILSRCISRL